MNRCFLLLLTLMTSFPTDIWGNSPRVFVFTDINIDSGDPDDRQSLIHLLWYADDLEIEGIVPDRWNARSVEACNLVLDAYNRDYDTFSLDKLNYPPQNILRNKIAGDYNQAVELFIQAASDPSSPLYVLIWGNMKVFQSILIQRPDLADNIRLITIGTGLMLEEDIEHMPPSWEKSAPCKQLNWNGAGREAIYDDERFSDMWWLEINWTYAGMFVGEEPAEMFEKLSQYGAMGKHIKEVVKNESWAQYFRVGDTPSVLYIIDPGHTLEDPTEISWAGKFVKPMPQLRPNYYTDSNGSVEWNYQEPCSTWSNHGNMRDQAVQTLLNKRPEMYRKLLEKLDLIYKN